MLHRFKKKGGFAEALGLDSLGLGRKKRFCRVGFNLKLVSLPLVKLRWVAIWATGAEGTVRSN